MYPSPVGGHELTSIVARKKAVLEGNTDAVMEYGKALATESSALYNRLEELSKEHSRLTTKMKGDTEQFKDAEAEVRTSHLRCQLNANDWRSQALGALTSQVERCITTMQSSLEHLKANELESSSALERVQSVQTWLLQYSTTSLQTISWNSIFSSA